MILDIEPVCLFIKKILFNVTDSFRQVNTPIKQTQLQQLKKKRKHKLRIQKTFVELILYLVFVFVLYLISFSNRDSRWFHAKEHIDQELITLTNVSKGDSTLRFNQVLLQNIKQNNREINYLYCSCDTSEILFLTSLPIKGQVGLEFWYSTMIQGT